MDLVDLVDLLDLPQEAGEVMINQGNRSVVKNKTVLFFFIQLIFFIFFISKRKKLKLFLFILSIVYKNVSSGAKATAE